MAKILTIDIETAPNLAYVWGMWKQNIGLAQFKEHSYIMSFAAKWLGSDEVLYKENRHGDDKALVEDLILLLSSADIVIAHNAKRFDLPIIHGRALVHGIAPPAPYKIVDTLIEAKKEFRFLSNKLEHLADVLGCAPKLKHAQYPGFELWLQCLKQNDEAWAEMKEYNIQDVVTLEEVYLKMRPWMKGHPNIGIFDEQEVPVCPKCGSKHVHKRGYVTTNVSKFSKFRCVDCGGWGRARINELDKDKRKQLLMNVAG